MDKHDADKTPQIEPTPDTAEGGAHAPDDKAIAPNPPRTTKGGITAPKFGSAGSGGAELDPGPERD
ncbi:MAG TPA: hypothetical protein VN706_13310 [Gemmatimonadaceae bacterium]|nr:hypothetical protein [Gemmatimonadaceae bacterium]